MLVPSMVGEVLPVRDVRASDSCLMIDYVRVINFRIIIIIFYTPGSKETRG